MRLVPDHPSAIALESIASGEDDPDTRAHLETCAECRAHVEALAQAIGKGPPAAAFVAELRERAKTKVTASPTARPRRIRAATYAAGVLALAAGVLLFVRAPSAPGDPTTTPSVLMKGRPSLSVIRERAKSQERIAGTCRVRPGDRLRLELAIAEPSTITAGVLTKEGQWLELEPPGAFDHGTHLSRSSLTVDAAGIAGRAIVGSPEDVERARRGQPSAAVGLDIERDPTR